MIEESIELTEQDKKWLDAQVASGRYKSISEVIHELIEPWNIKPISNRELAAALKAGEESGVSEQNPREFLAELKAKHRQ